VLIKEYWRIAATMAKQILMKKIKHIEREKSARYYQNKIGDIVYGEIKRATFEILVVDFGNNAEVILPKKDLRDSERYRVGDKI
ncbi:transcription termination/antitermination protein NusA, partial [Francisella tularensis subsp. holarctica]|nr:transcription termination/antitermination protein NusA [Francisella tularensis subsp. holarctica]